MNTVLGLIYLLSSLCCTEATISGWTNPTIMTANGTGSATPTIPEDKPVGLTGVAIAATAAGTKVYAIIEGTNKLTIDGSSGALSLATGKSFDFETEPFYILKIKCTDGGDNSTGTATVTLNITNVNESPVFSKNNYAATISDGAKAGTALVTVTATDVDAGSTITYTITGGNTNTDFKIDASTGAITVAAGKTLDMSTTGSYNLTVTASDGTLTATTIVHAKVTPPNSGTVVMISVVMAMLVSVFTVA